MRSHPLIPSPHFQLPVTNYQLPITNYQLPIPSPQSPALRSHPSQSFGKISHLSSSIPMVQTRTLILWWG
ncbi:hypothetical protein JYQ62_19660 [Nostoc sp. UHCC 0702]|nr:hypothetical protein JYQ62_19660 [Nostoc sp. UHCC 0702]